MCPTPAMTSAMSVKMSKIMLRRLRMVGSFWPTAYARRQVAASRWALFTNRGLFRAEVGAALAPFIRRYGGIDGYFRHCQALDRASAGRAKSRPREEPG